MSTESKPFSMPLIGGLPVASQLKLLGGVFLALLLLIGALAASDYRAATNGAVYVSTAGNMRMLTQRIAKAAQTGLAGSSRAFNELETSRGEFATALMLLRDGGQAGAVLLPPSPDRVMPVVDELAQAWEPTERNLGTLLAQQQGFAGLTKAVREMAERSPGLPELAEQYAAARAASGSARELALAGQMVMRTQRLERNVDALLGTGTIPADPAAAMGADLAALRELSVSLREARAPARGKAPAADDSAALLDRYDAGLKEFDAAVKGMLANIKPLLAARQSARAVVADSDRLLGATQKLADAYADELERAAAPFKYFALAVLAATLLYLMFRTFAAEERRRFAQAEASRLEAERQNKANQEAILRLMNEIQDFSEGDLRGRATVTEDITGAIADAVNFTIEELSVLVGQVNAAAGQVALAAESARGTSTELLDAASRQAEQIRTASGSVLDMASGVGEISAGAAQSAQVARESLAAAERGQAAVHDSMAGMDGIRIQIQDTAKRIKRLGESSQEIGEIVGLITDLTEQTNVLALNAAIQAASAGEAGRGFAVVAEEVQRLAERSAGAAQRIDALVRTIQADTQDTVAAMERSTQGVVQGAALTDAAGHALARIGEVSRDLATLIERISATTERQARQAEQVGTAMREIDEITRQTTAGTRRTAGSIDELAALAASLKQSVSGFKIN